MEVPAWSVHHGTIPFLGNSFGATFPGGFVFSIISYNLFFCSLIIEEQATTLLRPASTTTHDALVSVFAVFAC